MVDLCLTAPRGAVDGEDECAFPEVVVRQHPPAEPGEAHRCPACGLRWGSLAITEVDPSWLARVFEFLLPPVTARTFPGHEGSR